MGARVVEDDEQRGDGADPLETREEALLAPALVRPDHLVPLPVMVSRFWRVHGVARQGRRERQYAGILARLRTQHGGAGRRQKRTDYCWEGHYAAEMSGSLIETYLLNSRCTACWAISSPAR